MGPSAIDNRARPFADRFLTGTLRGGGSWLWHASLVFDIFSRDRRRESCTPRIAGDVTIACIHRLCYYRRTACVVVRHIGNLDYRQRSFTRMRVDDTVNARRRHHYVLAFPLSPRVGTHDDAHWLRGRASANPGQSGTVPFASSARIPPPAIPAVCVRFFPDFKTSA